MWLINKIVKDPNDPLEAHLEQLIRADLAGCSDCQRVYEMVGMIPLWCSTEHKVRDLSWVRDIEQQARKLLHASRPTYRIRTIH